MSGHELEPERGIFGNQTIANLLGGRGPDTPEEPRWETVYGTSERQDDGLLKITVEGRTHIDTELPTTRRIGFAAVVDDRHDPYAYQHSLRRLVRALERAGMA